MDAVYQCRVQGEEKAYNVLLSENSSEEKQNRIQFYVEDTNGNAVASGKTASLGYDAAESVMQQIGLLDNEEDCVINPLIGAEGMSTIQMMHERSLDITKLPSMVVLSSEYPDQDQIVKQQVYCADDDIAYQVAEYAMNKHEQLQEYSGQDINLVINIKVRPDIEEQKINQMLDRTEQYRAYEYYNPEQETVEFLLVESDKENSRIKCSCYGNNLDKNSETILNYESRLAFGEMQQDFNVSELLHSKEFRSSSDKLQDIPAFKPINADELLSDIMEKNDVINGTEFDKGDKVITLYDKSTNEVTFCQVFHDISDVDLLSLQNTANGVDRYEVTKGDEVLFKGNVTDAFNEEVRGSLDELEAVAQETEERVLGDRELEPISNAELAAQIAELIYAHDDEYMDISLDDIQADILNRLEDSVASGNVERLQELSSRLEAFADIMTDEEKTVAAICAEHLNALENVSEKTENFGISLEHEQAVPSKSASELFQGNVQGITDEKEDKNWTMKKVEESEEENYNCIDGTLNNLKSDKKQPEESFHNRIEEGKERAKKLAKAREHEDMADWQHSDKNDSR